MKAKKIIPVGVTAMVFLKVVIGRFIRLLKGERVVDFLARTGGLKDTSIIGLMNIGSVALFSLLKKVRDRSGVGSNIRTNNDKRIDCVSLSSSKIQRTFSPLSKESNNSHKQNGGHTKIVLC